MQSVYAIVRAGVVDNVVVWDGDTSSWPPPEGADAHRIDANASVNVGDLFDGVSFSAPTSKS